MIPSRNGFPATLSRSSISERSLTFACNHSCIHFVLTNGDRWLSTITCSHCSTFDDSTFICPAAVFPSTLYENTILKCTSYLIYLKDTLPIPYACQFLLCMSYTPISNPPSISTNLLEILYFLSNK